MEAAKNRRKTAKQKFTRCRNNLMEALDNRILPKTVSSRFAELKNSWDKVQEKHDEYIAHLPEEENEEDWISQLSKKYCEAEEKTDAFLEDCQKTERQEEEMRR